MKNPNSSIDEEKQATAMTEKRFVPVQTIHASDFSSDYSSLLTNIYLFSRSDFLFESSRWRRLRAEGA